MSAPKLHRSALLRRIQPRCLRLRANDTLRDAEVRWQERNDPRIAEAHRAGISKADIAQRLGTSKGAVLNALRRHASRSSRTGGQRT